MRWLALSGIAAPVFYVAGTALAAALRPDYSLISHTVSRLGEEGAPYAMLFVYLGQIPSGLMTVAFAVVLHHALGGGARARVGSTLVGLGGVGVLLSSAVFPRNPWPSPPGAAHLGIGLAAALAFAIAPLVLAAPLRLLGEGYRWFSAATGTALVLGIALSPLPFYASYPGLGQRLLATIAYLWMAVLALQILQGSRGRPSGCVGLN